MFLGSSCCNIAENSTFARPLDFACRLNPSFHAFAEACATETLGAYFSYRYCNTTLCGVPENYPITYALLIFEGLWAEDIKNIGFQRLLIYQYYCRHQ